MEYGLEFLHVNVQVHLQFIRTTKVIELLQQFNYFCGPYKLQLISNLNDFDCVLAGN